MSGLNSLRGIFQKKGEQYVADLMRSYVVVNEKLEGSYFAAMLDLNNEFKYFKKGAEINYADRVLNRFYNKAINHFESIQESVRLEIPSFYLFAMQYFPQTGRLVLSHIHELSADGTCTRIVQDKRVLDAWSSVLGIEKPAILFEGFLSEEQKSALLQLLEQPTDEFKQVPFERALLTILGITEDREISTVVFRFYEDERRNEERSVIAKLASPAIESLLKERQPEDVTKVKSDDFVWLILVDLINFIETFTVPELQEIKLDSSNHHVRYVELINALYKRYVENDGLKWEGLELNTPDYLKDHKFDLNTDLISSTAVKDLVNSSSINKEIYRIMLNMFRNPNVKINSKIFTEGMKNNLRMQIEKLSAVTLDKQISETYFPTFTEFLGQSMSYSVFEDDAEPVKKNCDVNVVIDYFQPINKSHIKVAQKLHEKNGNKVILVAVTQVNDHNKYPLSEDDTQKMLESIKADNPELVEAVRVIPNWSIEAIIEALGAKYVPTLLACTSKRIMDYAQHLEYYQRRNSPLVESIKNIKLVEVDHNDFGDQVRSTLADKDYNHFRKLTPKSIHRFFESIAPKYSQQLNESKEEGTAKELQEHVRFLKMVISEDSNVTVETRSSIISDLNVVKKKFESKEDVLELKREIVGRQISEQDANNFVDGIVNEAEVTNDDIVRLKNLIQSGITLQMDKVNLVKLDSIFEQQQINPVILDRVLAYKLQGHDGAGVGEFATSILFTKAKKLPENGDVVIDESKVEVKSNDSQLFSIRSVNESIAFRDSVSVLEKRISRLKEIVLSTGSDKTEQVLELLDVKLATKNDFNINQKGIRNYVNLFRSITESIQEIPAKKLHEWFASIFVGGILADKESLPTDAKKKLTEQVASVFEAQTDAKELLSRLTYLTFKYYANVDGFDGMLIYRNNHESTKYACVYLPEAVSYEDYIRFVEPISGPSMVDARTSKSFKIRMRPLDK